MRLSEFRNSRQFSWRKKAVCMFFSFLLLSLFLDVPDVQANSESAETVKIGYYENEVFEEGAAPGAVKTGYAYEYYRKLSEYTGWNYEYVYGGFGELYDMLLAGEIDLLAGLAKREDRLDIIGYPSVPMGNEIYTLVKHDDDTSVTFSASSISGKKIGVLKSAIAEVLQTYLDENEINAEVVSFDDYESLFTAFDTKQVDILAAEGDGAYGRDHAEVICTFGTSDYYLCVSIKRPDILAELDEAQSMLAMEEPNYIGTLQSKYYSSSVSSHTFSAAERDWLTEHKELKIGYLNNYLPYSTTDRNGDVHGIVKDIVPRMLSDLAITDVSVSYVGYDRYDDMISDIREDKIDVVFPVGGGLYYSEENGIYQSTSVVSASTELVFKDEYDADDVQKFAVNENNRMQYYFVRTNYPDAEIVMYPDIDACLKAVMKGEVGATTLNGLRANDMLKNSKYDGLFSKPMTKADDRCFGVKIGNEGLLKLFNRGIKVIGADYISEIAYKYSEELYTYTFMDRVKDNLWLLLVLSLTIAILIIALITRDLKHTQQENRMKSDFVSNMSHEIRTPITAILGMNEMIQLETDDANVLRYSGNIAKAGESLLGIINDILDFSKIEAGRMELITAPYLMPELIGELQMMVIKRAEEKGLNFEMQIDERLPREAVGDVQKLRQVITNILTNAVKYTKEGSVKLSMTLLSREEDHFTMEVAVEDTGIGIKAEEMGKLFSAFDRLDLEKTKSIEGSGLGLTISQRLLSMMNSRIEVTSEYGKGSRFWFVLEQGISDGTEIGSYKVFSAGDDEKYRGRRDAMFTAPDARILIVDDTPMNLQVICGLLKSHQMTIDTANGGEECLALFSQNTYDMVFLDQRMPNMDGVETLAKIKELYPEAAEKTPIVCLTANVLEGGKEHMLQSGFTDYLTKPVTLFEIEQTLIKYLPYEKIHRLKKMPEEAAADEDEIQVPDEIEALEALDTEMGLDYCGDAEEYLEALKIYKDSAKEKSAKLRELTEATNREAVTLLVHSIKSTSRAIGAKELSAEAEELEAISKDAANELPNDRLIKFAGEYEALGASIGDALDRAQNK
jgi:signal transduction histidine kinase/response regulator of citrate/malate metabolism